MRFNYVGDAILVSLLAILIIVAIVLAVRHYAALAGASNYSYASTEVSVSGAIIEVQIADTAAKQMTGLSYRENLSSDHGMLFVFGGSGIRPFWMKGMKFSIDIIWIDKNKNIVYIIPGASPDSYPRIYSPLTPAQYVLEVPAGWCAIHNVSVGNGVIFEM